MENKIVRNLNVDVIRAVTILLILLYHFSGFINPPLFSNSYLNFLVLLGGEIGVTAFFIMSGYGIYYSLTILERKNELNFYKHLGDRMSKLLPLYWFSLVLILFLMDGSYYLDYKYFFEIATHFLMIHGLFPNFSGSVSGVVWMMTDIFVFYTLSIPLFRIIKKMPIVFLGMSVLLTCLSKYFMVCYCLPYFKLDSGYNFWGGRSVFISVLDNFSIGMFVAHISIKYNFTFNKKIINNIIYAIMTMISLCILYYIGNWGIKRGIHTNNFSGYVFHSILALGTGCSILCFSQIKNSHSSYISKALLVISRYEFGIFLFHLELVRNIMNKSGALLNLKNRNMIFLLLLALFFICISFGILMQFCTRNLKLTFDSKKIKIFYFFQLIVIILYFFRYLF